MPDSKRNIHPEFHRMLPTEAKERLLGQNGLVVWMYGMSGSGKSTLAVAAEKYFHEQGRATQLLDGDNIRHGINSDLGFSLEDRHENIRRVAEIAKLFRNAGILTFSSFITPTEALRTLARDIIGKDSLVEVYVHASYESCETRDVKGLYAKARKGELSQFTGKDSLFEPPTQPTLILNTETHSVEESLQQLIEFIEPRILGTANDHA